MRRLHPLPFLLATLAAPVPACRQAEASGTPAAGAPATAAPTLAVPEPVRHVSAVEATGTLRARQQAQLAFVIAGTLERIAVRRGQAVAEGAPLLLLDAAAARAQLAQAEAGADAARAQVGLAEDALARLEAIRRDEGGVTESQLVQARKQLELARAQAAGALAQRDQARVQVGRHVLRAPFAGVVTRVPDGVGVAVSAGVPVAAIESVRQLVLDTSLTQEEAAGVKVGDRVEVTVPATGARTADASVAVVVPSVDPATNRVPVEIAVPNPEGRMLAHAFARARLPSAAPRPALKVPAAAVVQREGAFALWIAGGDGRARALPVRVLAQQGDSAVVEVGSPGFPADAKVVAMPPLGIAEGQPVAGGVPR